VSETRVVGVRFRRAGKVYYFDPGDIDPGVGDTVVVETIRGLEVAEVVVAGRMVPEDEISQPLRPVLRKATPDDLARLEKNREKEKEALDVCERKIAEHGLEMSLVDAEYTLDRAKLIFYFTAEGRVDFRQLVRDLSSTFKTRIELRQIGVRDEAKMIGGLGPCGRQLCCCTFLTEFQPVSIRMAKRQDLSLNPNKISGLCGRLMCCLRYENDYYPDPKAKNKKEKARQEDGPEPEDAAGGEPPADEAEGAQGARRGG
jgi:cell fate regulator YaaT (PSP1 superfamily)